MRSATEDPGAVILSAATGLDVLWPWPVPCKCGHVTQLFHNIGGATYCEACQPQQETL